MAIHHTYPNLDLETSSKIEFRQDFEYYQIHKDLVTQNQNLLALLGDFWYDQYADYDTVKNYISSVEALFASQFKEVLRVLLGSNVIDISEEKKLDFSVIILDSPKAVYNYNSEGQIESVDYRIDHFNTDSDYQKIKYLTSNILDPHVVLKSGQDFELLESGTLRFYVDVFNDENILQGVHSYLNQVDDSRQVLLWVSNYVVTTYDIHNRFGSYSLDYVRPDSSDHKAVVAALQYFFTNQKNFNNISSTLNILSGVPFSKSPGEKVLGIHAEDSQGNILEHLPIDVDEQFPDTQEEISGVSTYTVVVTDKNRYSVVYGTPVLVEEGQTLAPYQILAQLYAAEDYLTNPNWYEKSRFPFELLEGFDFDNYPGWEDYYREISRVLFNSAHKFDGSRKFYGLFYFFKSVSEAAGGNPVEVELHRLMDQVMKYNLVHIKGDISYKNYENFKTFFSSLFDLYKSIKPGFPVYLYPVFDFLIFANFADLVPEPTEFTTILAKVGSAENDYDPYIPNCRKYNSELSHEIFWTEKKNSKHLHNGLITYGEQVASFYNCPGISEEQTLDKAKIRITEFTPLTGVGGPEYLATYYNCGLFHDATGRYGLNPQGTRRNHCGQSAYWDLCNEVSEIPPPESNNPATSHLPRRFLRRPPDL
jgi:hypothetical protein